MRPTPADKPPKPTKEQLASAHRRRVPDVIAPGLKVLFVGVNPGLYTAAIGHHFGRPGNRFWPAMHQGGFTDRLWSPSEDRELLSRGYGLTNFVARPTARADQLTAEELRAGARRLERKIRRFRPRCAAVVGITAYRTAFGRPEATIGRQDHKIGETLIWVLPNTSGLNAHYLLPDQARLFAELRAAVEA